MTSISAYVGPALYIAEPWTKAFATRERPLVWSRDGTQLVLDPMDKVDTEFLQATAEWDF